jgi:hypothetical protein
MFDQIDDYVPGVVRKFKLVVLKLIDTGKQIPGTLYEPRLTLCLFHGLVSCTGKQIEPDPMSTNVFTSKQHITVPGVPSGRPHFCAFSIEVQNKILLTLYVIEADSLLQSIYRYTVYCPKIQCLKFSRVTCTALKS